MYRRMKERLLQKYMIWVTAVSLIAVIVAGSSISGLAKSRGPESASYKCYTSIAIQKGDTLWSIAKEHMSPEHDRIEEYIKEVQRLNHLKDSSIYAGEYLTIPKYRSRNFKSLQQND